MCFEIVGRVTALPAEQPGLALVDIDGSQQRISLVVLDVEGVTVSEGDWLLTHTGLALARLGAAEAADLVEQRRAMLAAAQQEAMRDSGAS